MTRCEAKRKDGKRCSAKPLPGKRCCLFHDRSTAAARDAGRKLGGASRAGTSTMPADAPPLPLNTAADVLAALAEAYNLTRTGRLGVREANALGLIAGTILRAVEARALESEVAALKDKVDQLAAGRGRGR